MNFTHVTLWTDGTVTVAHYDTIAPALLQCVRLARSGGVDALVLTGGDETFFAMGT